MSLNRRACHTWNWTLAAAELALDVRFGDEPVLWPQISANRLAEDLEVWPTTCMSNWPSSIRRLNMKQKNLDIYGHEPLPWSRALEQLERTNTAGGPATTFWLSTVGPDGSPHCAGVGALWVDGHIYFTSGPGTRKSRNLAHNPQCAISVGLPGLDLIIRGRADRVTDQPTLEQLAERYAAQGWPARADTGALTAPFSAPAAGPPPWYLYVVTPISAIGTASADPQGATRWTF